MQKVLASALIVFLSVSLFGCANTRGSESQPPDHAEPAPAAASDEAQVSALVETFGRRLQAVSLLAPGDVVTQSMHEQYGALVTPDLLAKWQSDPQAAPGRLTSSPWPDHIAVRSIKKVSDDEYRVEGDIVEITSVEQVHGGAAAKRPITLVVKRISNRWLIVAVTLGPYEQAASTIYSNNEFGFTFSLPASWQGYTIVPGQWEGSAPGETTATQTGPMISIRHPRWTQQSQRQDIPIMIFALTQWNSLQAGEFHIGAAPIGPSELGRNASYVFALPARYNFAFPPGYEEVESILRSSPLRAAAG